MSSLLRVVWTITWWVRWWFGLVEYGYQWPADDGYGCWYCGYGGDSDLFSWEFDTPVHKFCLRQRLREHPEDPEAQLMGREFGML